MTTGQRLGLLFLLGNHLGREYPAMWRLAAFHQARGLSVRYGPKSPTISWLALPSELTSPRHVQGIRKFGSDSSGSASL